VLLDPIKFDSSSIQAFTVRHDSAQYSMNMICSIQCATTRLNLFVVSNITISGAGFDYIHRYSDSLNYYSSGSRALRLSPMKGFVVVNQLQLHFVLSQSSKLRFGSIHAMLSVID
jgi:hypothetical protein